MKRKKVYDEGDNCPLCEKHNEVAALAYTRWGDCTCHISPPCSACVDAHLQCEMCGFRPLEEDLDDMEEME